MISSKRLVFLSALVVLSSSCGGGAGTGSVAGDSGERPEGRVCNTVYYQEIIGSYSGQITAKEFEYDKKENLLNQCDWEVSLSIEELKTPVDYGRYGCLMRATYDARLISQVNNSSSVQYQCLEIKDVMRVSEDHALDSEFWNGPVWPIDIDALGSYEYHPFNPPNPVVSPQTGGTVSSFDMRVSGDGSIDFGVNVLSRSTQLEGLLIKE
jgi:hypothetical protein